MTIAGGQYGKKVNQALKPGDLGFRRPALFMHTID